MLKDYGLFTKNPPNTVHYFLRACSKQRKKKKHDKALKIKGKYPLTLNPIQTLITHETEYDGKHLLSSPDLQRSVY